MFFSGLVGGWVGGDFVFELHVCNVFFVFCQSKKLVRPVKINTNHCLPLICQIWGVGRGAEGWPGAPLTSFGPMADLRVFLFWHQKRVI